MLCNYLNIYVTRCPCEDGVAGDACVTAPLVTPCSVMECRLVCWLWINSGTMPSSRTREGGRWRGFLTYTDWEHELIKKVDRYPVTAWTLAVRQCPRHQPLPLPDNSRDTEIGEMPPNGRCRGRGKQWTEMGSVGWMIRDIFSSARSESQQRIFAHCSEQSRWRCIKMKPG